MLFKLLFFTWVSFSSLANSFAGNIRGVNVLSLRNENEDRCPGSNGYPLGWFHYTETLRWTGFNYIRVPISFGDNYTPSADDLFSLLDAANVSGIDVMLDV